ncbi:hypothetical protein AALP_AAs47034U000100, partial [Arabis alpina]
ISFVVVLDHAVVVLDIAVFVPDLASVVSIVFKSSYFCRIEKQFRFSQRSSSTFSFSSPVSSFSLSLLASSPLTTT